MISKPVAASAVLALMLAAAGCNQATPPVSMPTSPSNSSAPAAPVAEFQSTTPSSSVRAPGLAEATGRDVGEALDDATITAKVKAALLQAADVNGLDVTVGTDKAVVQLSGFVASQAQIDKAIEVTKDVRGVREVQNKMSVKPG